MTTIANFILAGIAGVAGGGLVTPMALGMLPPAARIDNAQGGGGIAHGAGGTAGSDGGLPPRLRLRLRCYPRCPPIIGGIAAMILWFFYGPAVDSANVILAAAGLGLVGGAAGGTGSIVGQSLFMEA